MMLTAAAEVFWKVSEEAELGASELNLTDGTGTATLAAVAVLAGATASLPVVVVMLLVLLSALLTAASSFVGDLRRRATCFAVN